MKEHSITHSMNRQQEHDFLEQLFKSQVLIGNVYVDYFGVIYTDKLCDCILVAKQIRNNGYKAKTHLHI